MHNFTKLAVLNVYVTVSYKCFVAVANLAHIERRQHPPESPAATETPEFVNFRLRPVKKAEEPKKTSDKSGNTLERQYQLPPKHVDRSSMHVC